MTYSEPNTFLLGEAVRIPTLSGWDVDATIQGKINDELYVVSLRSPGAGVVASLANKYGLPNRHLTLEWGHFRGWDAEFIVPTVELSR